MGQIHSTLSQCAFRAFFLRIHYHMQNKRIHMTLLMRFTENDYLCDDINEQDGVF